MDNLKETLAYLTKQRDAFNEAIAVLQKLNGSVMPPRVALAASKKKPNWSPEAKRAAADRMKKYWAKRKRAEARG